MTRSLAECTCVLGVCSGVAGCVEESGWEGKSMFKAKGKMQAQTLKREPRKVVAAFTLVK